MGGHRDEAVGGRLRADAHAGEVLAEKSADEAGLADRVLSEEQHNGLGVEIGGDHGRAGGEVGVPAGILQRLYALQVKILEAFKDSILVQLAPISVVCVKYRRHIYIRQHRRRTG